MANYNNVEITYEELTPANLAVIQKLQHTIFPESSFEEGYALFLDKGPQAFDYVSETYYIAYVDGKPAGTYGLYIPKGVEEHHSIWLGWYGILPAFRGRGLGKKILLESISKARTYMSTYGIKYFRLYTCEAINDSAQPLYNKVMTLKEYYRNEEMFTEETFAMVSKTFPDKTEQECRQMLAHMIAIFSIALGEEILVPWESRYMNLKHMRKLEKDYTTISK